MHRQFACFIKKEPKISKILGIIGVTVRGCRFIVWGYPVQDIPDCNIFYAFGIEVLFK